MAVPRRAIGPGLLLLAIAGAITGAVGLAVTPRAEAATGPCDTSQGNVTPLEQSLFDMVNGWRAQHLAQPAMALSGPANEAAQWFAEAVIAGTTSGHIDEYERNWLDRLRDCGYDAFWAQGSGEALASFGSSNPALGSTPTEALAVLTGGPPGTNGVNVAIPWQCVGVGYASNPNAGFGQFTHVWVVVVVQFSSTSCPQGDGGGGATPTSTPITPPATFTPTPTATPTPIATTTPDANYGMTIAIYLGWNLISLPAGELDDILDTAASCIAAVYGFEGNAWTRYGPQLPPYARSLTHAGPGEAFWVQGIADCGPIEI